MCMMFSQCNTCSMVIYLIRYNIKGSVATSRAMPTRFYLSIMKLASSGFMYNYYTIYNIYRILINILYGFNNSLVHPRKHHFKIQ